MIDEFAKDAARLLRDETCWTCMYYRPVVCSCVGPSVEGERAFRYHDDWCPDWIFDSSSLEATDV